MHMSSMQSTQGNYSKYLALQLQAGNAKFLICSDEYWQEKRILPRFIRNLPNNFKLSKVWQQAATLELLPHLVFILSLAVFI